MSEDPAQKRVLVIEDDRALNRAIVFKLQKKGYDVVSVFSAEEGLIVLESGKRIDFIWLDLLLPGMNGIDFLRKVRSEESLRDKRVAIVSVSGGEDKMRQARELGPVDYVIKSDYSINDLVERVTHDL